MRVYVAFLLLAFLFMSLLAEESFDYQRFQMVERQLRGRDIDNEEVLEAFLRVPRHLLIPRQRRSQAYRDGPVPIGYGQTISQPYIVAYMTQVIEPGRDYKVLEIGTGSGYQAAILAEIVKSVYTIEIVPELAERSANDLKQLDYDNIKVKHGDGYFGWEEYAPFDAIVVTAAAEYIPPPLLDQLKIGGKMVIPVGSPFLVQNLVLVEKQKDSVVTRNLFPVRFVPFTRQD